MKNKRSKKIHRDKNGREFIKETYFVGGKMKFHRIYVIDGIPADEFYEKNATKGSVRNNLPVLTCSFAHSLR